MFVPIKYGRRRTRAPDFVSDWQVLALRPFAVCDRAHTAVYQSPCATVVEVELAELDPAGIFVELTECELLVSGNTRASGPAGQRRVCHRFYVEDCAAVSHVTAVSRDGSLRITLHRAPGERRAAAS